MQYSWLIIGKRERRVEVVAPPGCVCALDVVLSV